MKKILSVSAAVGIALLSTVAVLPSANAYVGTLENGNLAYAQSEFNKGEACNYLPGFETGYDAWHFVLTTRGATFQQDTLNPLASVNLNFVFMRQDNSLFTIRTGAWVQTGKGAYVYTLVSDRIRMVQVGSLAKINGVDSGIRLSHTCPGTGTPTNLGATATPTASPSPTVSKSPSPSPTPTATASPSPTPTATASPSPSPSPTVSKSPTASPSPTATASPSPSPTIASTPTASPSPTAITIAGKYIGTLENGDGAPADSAFNKGEACIYLPGYETGYDAWHFVLTTRGATFQQSTSNPAVSVNLNFIFKRTDGSTFTIKQGAWVQTGKGAYVYTLTKDKNTMVQSGSYAELNPSLSSGMRLSHTCPGTGSVTTATASPTPTPTPSQTPTASKSPTPTPTISPSASPTPTPTASKSPTPSPTPTVTKSPTPTPSPTVSPSPSATPCACDIVITKLKKVMPTPKPSKQPIEVAPTPTPKAELPTPTPTPTPSPSSSNSSRPTPNPSGSPEPTLEPPVLPTPPSNIDPKEITYVTPENPPTVDPKQFPEPPASPVIVTELPKFGDLKENPNGTFTYIPNAVGPATPTVDQVTFQYTALSGATVVVRKQFLLVEKGDVPSIIQTGYGPLSESKGYLLFLLLPIAFAAVVLRKVRKDA